MKMWRVLFLVFVFQSMANGEPAHNKGAIYPSNQSRLVEKFRAREESRRRLFYKSEWVLNPSIFLSNALLNQSRPFARPLDGQMGKNPGEFTLYTGQFYRFLLQSDAPASHLLIKVHEKGKVIHEEKIALPIRNTPSWDRYLIQDGMVCIPETKLKTEFGLGLRLEFVPNPDGEPSLIIGQKGSYSNYQYSFSLDEGRLCCINQGQRRPKIQA